MIESNVRDPKVGLLTKWYFRASRSGKRGTVNYQLQPMKAHTLQDEYDIDPPSDEELSRLGLYDTDIITMPKTKELEAIAAEVADEY